MMLTTKGRYAVMAMADMACVCENKKPVVLSDVAQRQSIPLAYLEQIAVSLKQAGLLQSVRGRNGGYLLAKDKADITVLEVIQAAEEAIEMTRCQGQEEGCLSHGRACITHHLWEGLSQAIHGYLASYTLADVIKQPEPVMEVSL